jgi:hypothetical protein
MNTKDVETMNREQRKPSKTDMRQDRPGIRRLATRDSKRTWQRRNANPYVADQPDTRDTYRG